MAWDPPTRKQLMYIQSLCQKLNYRMKVGDTPVTKKEASKMIDRLMGAEDQEDRSKDYCNNFTEERENEKRYRESGS